MRKWIAGVLVAGLLAGSALTASAVNENRGGLMGFIAGCCFGIRSGAAYNTVRFVLIGEASATRRLA